MPYQMQSINFPCTLSDGNNTVDLVNPPNNHAVVVHAFTAHRKDKLPVTMSSFGQPHEHTVYLELLEQVIPIISWPFDIDVRLGNPSIAHILCLLQPNNTLRARLKCNTYSNFYIGADISVIYGLLTTPKHILLQARIDQEMQKRAEVDGKLGSFLETL